jgi:hypothetical protein
MTEPVLYLAPKAGRLFLVPGDFELPAGDLLVISGRAGEHEVDAAAIASFEIQPGGAAQQILDELLRADGKRVDEVLDRLERQLGPFVGMNRAREKQRRRQEYQRSARTAIADALREAGIEPLS